MVYIASKTYYFGVGGGTKAFSKLLLEDGIFEVTAAMSIEEAASGNKREVRHEGTAHGKMYRKPSVIV